MGKPEENLGDSLDGFDADLTEAVDALDHLAASARRAAQHARPRHHAAGLRPVSPTSAPKTSPTRSPPSSTPWRAKPTPATWMPVSRTKIQTASPTPTASAARSRRRSRPSRASWSTAVPVVSPRWVGSGWTIFNNKGKPVRQYEPFFSRHPRFRVRRAGRRQPDPVLRPGRARRRHPAPQPHLREGGVRPVAAGHLGRQRHRAAATRGPMPTSGATPPAISPACPQARLHCLADLARAATRRCAGRTGAGRGRARPLPTPTRPRRPTSTPSAAPS